MIDDPFSLQRGISQKQNVLIFFPQFFFTVICIYIYVFVHAHTQRLDTQKMFLPLLRKHLGSKMPTHFTFKETPTQSNEIWGWVSILVHMWMMCVCVCPQRGPASTGSLWHGACNGLGFDRNELLRRMVGHVYGNRSNEVHVWTRFGGLFSMETSNIVLVEPYHNGQGCAWWCPVLPKPAQRYG